MNKFLIFVSILIFIICCPSSADEITGGAESPIYSTYIASPEKSDYFVDEGYHLVYYDDAQPLKLATDTSGDLFFGFKLGNLLVVKTGDFYKKPEMIISYPDLFSLHAEPFKGIEITLNAALFTSRDLLVECQIEKTADYKREFEIFLFYGNSYQTIENVKLNKEQNSIAFEYNQPAKTWFQQDSLEGFKEKRKILVKSDNPIFAWGGYFIYDDNIFSEASKFKFLNGSLDGKLRAFALKFYPGFEDTRRTVRFVKSVVQEGEENTLVKRADEALNQRFDVLLESSRKMHDVSKLVSNLEFRSEDEKMLFIQGLYLAKQQFYPPAGRFPYSYYVFSREPTWSWGHEGQVFHESLSMQSLVLFDPQRAMDSQRNFAAIQTEDGYLPYRVGAFFYRDVPVEGRKTTSAPFYSWTNWEIYRITKDRKFLEEMYKSGSAYEEFLLKTRDTNGNGLLEWGGHVWLECVRDGYNAVWDIFGEGADAPKVVEALDMSCMVIKELKSLALMAKELGLIEESKKWQDAAERISGLINKYMWDEETGFYYHVHKDTLTFTTPDGKSLKRKEIIGFPPMWAGIASPEQAEKLMVHLKNPDEFWRRFGVPTLSADDPYFDAAVTACCKWNGPVWLTWILPVHKGILDYGYKKDAAGLLEKVEDAMLFQLRKNHHFWESYSPDYTQLYSPMNYIWDTLISRMIYDIRKK